MAFAAVFAPVLLAVLAVMFLAVLTFVALAQFALVLVALLALVFAALFGVLLAVFTGLLLLPAAIALVLARLLPRLGGGLRRSRFAAVVSRALCKCRRAEQQKRPEDECDVLHGESPVVIAP